MAKRVSIINFKGGVGKTTLAFHLATGLARYHGDKRVLLIDVDHQSSLSILCLGAPRWESEVANRKTVNRIFKHVTTRGSAMPGREIVINDPIQTGHYPTLDLVPASLQLDDTEIELAGYHTGDPIASEWIKRTLLCQWLEETRLDKEYDYIIVDCPPATKIVTQNAIALSHGYIVPVVPEAVMERGAPHLVELIRTGIDQKLKRLAAQVGERRTKYVKKTGLVGLVITRIQTAPRAPYTNDHTEHLHDMQRRWGDDLVEPYIEQGAGIGETLTAGVPVFDLEHTQNVGKRGFGDQFRALVENLRTRIDAL